MSVYNQPSLTKIPGYFTIQVHPENEGIPFLKDALEILNQFKDEGDEYRTNPLFIPTHLMPKERTKSTFTQVDRHILKDANPQQRELWSKTTRLKVWNLAFSAAKASLPLSEEEKQLVKPIMAFGAEHEEIPEKMQRFAKEFCEKIKNEEELDSLCAWTHQTLVDIHPYNDGNGRTARLFMNTIRMCVGKQPLLIDDDDSYTLAAEEHDPKVFYNYLQRLKEKQIIPTPFIDQCIRTLFEET